MSELKKVFMHEDEHIIDSLNKHPHIRHGAVIKDGIAYTYCGRTIKHFWESDDCSLLYTDGTIYAVECKKCFAQPKIFHVKTYNKLAKLVNYHLPSFDFYKTDYP